MSSHMIPQQFVRAGHKCDLTQEVDNAAAQYFPMHLSGTVRHSANHSLSQGSSIKANHMARCEVSHQGRHLVFVGMRRHKSVACWMLLLLARICILHRISPESGALLQSQLGECVAWGRREAE